jgi:HEAT repeat protein
VRGLDNNPSFLLLKVNILFLPFILMSTMNGDDFESLEEMIAHLHSEDIEIRQEAAWNIHKIAEQKKEELSPYISEITKAMQDSDWAVRKLVIMTLGELGVKEQMPAFQKALEKDSEPEVRVGAVEALLKIGSKEIIPSLMKALDDKAVVVRQVAISALGKLGKRAKEAVQKLVEVLLKEDEDYIIQTDGLTMWALVTIDDKSAIEPLTRALKSGKYSHKKFMIAYALAMLEEKKGVGFEVLQEMKDKGELSATEVEMIKELNSIKKE